MGFGCVMRMELFDANSGVGLLKGRCRVVDVLGAVCKRFGVQCHVGVGVKAKAKAKVNEC